MSILLMETAAFGGYELVMEAYDLAEKNGYQFGCFGDALLILND
ncbi:MAG: S-adenosylmethionine:tRNA ribosyltransferase-isomerase, partial [Prevotella sp.]|nr:S-adenosylmethionine:tRNA ribosyltransferase-isomerase [Prevotella sp.]